MVKKKLELIGLFIFIFTSVGIFIGFFFRCLLKDLGSTFSRQSPGKIPKE